MLITKSQAYELELLETFRHMQTRQLQWFMLRWGLPAEAFERDMRQLRYLGKVMLLGDYICLPGRRAHRFPEYHDVLFHACDPGVCAGKAARPSGLFPDGRAVHEGFPGDTGTGGAGAHHRRPGGGGV